MLSIVRLAPTPIGARDREAAVNSVLTRLAAGRSAWNAADIQSVLAVEADLVARLAEAAGPGRVAVLVLGYCGLRWSELAALRVRHFDLLRRRVLVEEAVTAPAWCGSPPRPTAAARCRCRGSWSTSWPARW
jgi:integrase